MRTSASTRGVVHGSLALLSRNAASAASLNSTSISMDSVDQHASERRSDEVDDLAMLLDELKPWDGPSVFVTADSLAESRGLETSEPHTPKRQSGRPCSPISVSSSDASPTVPLPRPRAVPQYSSPAARTAFTPPRPTDRSDMFRKSAYSNFTQRNVFQAREDNVEVGPSRLPATPTAKAMHPFFSKGFRSRSPQPKAGSPVPPAHEPRLVAYYSSTSASDMSNSQSTESTFGSQPVSNSQTSLKGKGRSLPEMDSLVDGVASLQVAAPSAIREVREEEVRPNRPPSQGKSTGKEVYAAPLPVPIRRRTFSDLPIFSYRTYTKRSPRVAYTTSMAEAEDLLGCLRGNVMGFDLEWPASGFAKSSDVGGKKRVPVGAKWNAAKGKYDFHQARTALAQVCDEDLVVLIHLRNPKDALPKKLVEILNDKSIYKLGVAVSNDGSKLVRDFPNQFTGEIASLLELSRLARTADPIGTGPGNNLIALATLVGVYLGRRLPKDLDVRASDWSQALGSDQIDYAVNDVWCSLQLYKTLMAKAEAAGITPNLDACSFSARPLLPASSRVTGTKISSMAARPAVTASRASPTQRQALQRFLAGEETYDIAASRGILLETVQQYICRALEALKGGELTISQKERVLRSVPAGSHTAKAFARMLDGYRRDVHAAKAKALH